MPVSGLRRPPAPTCEDCWDEDTQDVLSENRASANVAVKRSKSTEFDLKSTAGKKSHDGSDSGYSSKAGTSDITSTAPMSKPNDLKVDTNVVDSERKRQPYTFAPNPSDRARSPSKSKSTKSDKASTFPPRFRHDRGLCWVCDEYGYHFDIDKKMETPATAAPPQVQNESRAASQTRARAKEESDSRPRQSRRSSSTKRDTRPVSMYGAPGLFAFPPPPMDYSHPILAANDWQAAPQYVTPYSHYPYPLPQPTPDSATYAQPGFFDMSPSPYPQHGDSSYGHPSYNGYLDPSVHYKTSSHDGDSSRSASRDTRPRSTTSKSKRSSDLEKLALDRVTADRISMPPPPRPDHMRPVIKKASTEYPSISHMPRSVFDDDDEQADYQNIVARERHPSHSRPPSAWKTSANSDTATRPQPRRPSSYSNSSGTVFIASTNHREMPRRRTDPLDKKLFEAEHYVAKTNRQKEIETDPYLAAKARKQRDLERDHYSARDSRSDPNSALTADALRKFEQKQSNGISDAESVRSKHSSKDSANGRTRAGTMVTSISGATNITMDNGFSLSIPAECGDIPLDIMVGNLRLSNIVPVRDDERQREQKWIERAPSDISHTSHRSTKSSSAVGISKGIQDQQSNGRSKQSANSSKRSSRAASTNRADREIRSIDYSVLDESYYLDY